MILDQHESQRHISVWVGLDRKPTERRNFRRC
jgi:hypothetical protein